MKLTERLIASLKPDHSDVFAWDDALPGFGVRVKPSGVKSYLIQYRNADHVSKRYTLAKVTELRLEQARRRAAALLGAVKDERVPADPAADRKARQHADTMRELCERYLSDHAELHAKPSYLKQQRRMIGRIKDELGTKPVRAVTRADVQALHLMMRKTPYEANRVLALLSVMFKCAEHWKLRDEGTNPCRGIKRYREKRRERLLSDAEVARIYAAMREVETASTVPDGILLAIRLLFSTACRAGEILGLKWDYLDHDNGDIVWPDSKTGHMRKPLTTETAALLHRAAPIVGNPYICTSPSGTGPLSINTLEKAWRRLLKTADVAPCGLHSIRHRAATDIANNPDIPMHVGMKLTGHKTATTYLRYLHAHQDQARKAAEKVSRQRLAILKKPPTKVVPLQRRAG
jgi:integrase